MSRRSPSEPADGELLGPLYDVLSNGDRRHLLRILASRSEPVTMDEAAAAVVAARDHDGPTSVEKLDVVLHHNHVPKLVELGLVAEENGTLSYAATGERDAIVTALLDVEAASD